MKSKLLTAAILVAAPIVMASQGPIKEKAMALNASNKDSVLFISAVVEIEVTAGDNPARKEEKKIETLGTVIGADGLIVAPLSTLDVASQVDGRTVNTAQGPIKLSAKSTTKEVKILMPDGTEVEAKVAFKDADLDLAFIRPEKAGEAKLVPVNTKDLGTLAMQDDVIILGRLGKDLDRVPVVMTNEVVAVVSKPRTFIKLGAPSLGLPVFDKDGKFSGIGINRFSAKGNSEEPPSSAGVVLPASDLMESAAQAK